MSVFRSPLVFFFLVHYFCRYYGVLSFCLCFVASFILSILLSFVIPFFVTLLPFLLASLPNCALNALFV